MTHFVQLVQVLAWPVTVIILALLFRRQFRSVVARLTALRYRDFTADFSRDLSQLQEQVESLSPRADERAKAEETPESLSTYERLVRIAEISPRAAITEAWRDIEVTTKLVTDAYGVSVGGRIAGVRAIRQLVDMGLLPHSVLSVYERMRRLRARAAHAAEFAIDPEEAERYIDTAHQFHMALRFLLSEAQRTKGEATTGST